MRGGRRLRETNGVDGTVVIPVIGFDDGFDGADIMAVVVVAFIARCHPSLLLRWGDDKV
jgi:hypothetical protein